MRSKVGRGPDRSGNVKLGVLAALVIAAGMGMGVYYIFPTSDNSGYAPVQPIPFSHKIHAGQYGMDCKYCHSNVTKSRHATVPSMNVCMNCHRVVKTDSPHIQKLTELYNAGKPIEWIRIHELPDHAMFNHRAHIRKGLQCETCHGDIASMERVQQMQPLTMGWCIECHRGQTTPKNVKAKLLAENPHPKGYVAPQNCSTCHR